MPKLKTHKGMKKRFKVSANGKVSHKRCGSSHLMSHKSGKQVRRLRKKSTADGGRRGASDSLRAARQAERQSRRRRGRQAGGDGRHGRAEHEPAAGDES